MSKMEREMLLIGMGFEETARLFRISGTTEIVKASSIKAAIKKLVGDDFTYTPHWYNGSNRKSWASVQTSWGYKCKVEEI